MAEWLTILFDSRIFMRANAVCGFLFLGFSYTSIFRRGTG